MYVQVKLIQDLKYYTYAWTNMAVKLKQKVSIEGHDGVWEVAEIYKKIKLKDPPRTDWKVGGLA